jgi:hypothetical protein
VDPQLLGTDGDHNNAGLKASAMRLVKANARELFRGGRRS